MNGDETSRKVAAICESCGAAYAAVEHANGEILPIGDPTGCCSDVGLTILDDSSNSNGSKS